MILTSDRKNFGKFVIDREQPWDWWLEALEEEL
jgi:hypothetical protein